MFRSKDGGKTWQKFLYRSDKAGASDLIIDPTNRKYSLRGLLGGLSKALDARERRPRQRRFQIDRRRRYLDGNHAQPGITERQRSVSLASPFHRRTPIACGQSSRLKTAVSFVLMMPAKPGRRRTTQRNLRQRAWYYTRIYADPKNADTVYVLNTGFYKSNDGGKTFTRNRSAAWRQS